MDEASGAVLDASALLAFLLGESGRETVGGAISQGAVISVVNYAEVLTRLGADGTDPSIIHRRLRAQGLIGDLVQVAPLLEDDAVVIAQLRPLTNAQGLSLGDRACLATALRLGRPVITADRGWLAVDAGVTIRLVRP